jgi:hypothetical protein
MVPGSSSPTFSGAEHALVAAAENRQGAVRTLWRFVVFEVVAELGAFLFLAGDHAR